MSERKVLIEVDVPEGWPLDRIVGVDPCVLAVKHLGHFPSRIVQPALAQGDEDADVVYRWRALDHSGFCYGSNPPPHLPVRCDLTAFHRQRGFALDALREIAQTKNLTATPQQFAEHLQRVATEALSAQREQPTKWGDAQLMQNRYAAGFSCALHVAERQDLMSHIGSPEYLKRMANDLSQPAEQPQSVAVPREMSDDEIMSFVEPGMVNPHGSLYSHRIVEFARALLGQQEG